MARRATLASDRNPLQALFAAHCWPEGEVRCPRCGRRSVYPLKDGRYRCGACVYTFHDFTGRWLNRCALSRAQWMAVMRLFVEGVPATEMAGEIQVSYETTLKAVNTLRLSLLAGDPSFAPLLDEQGELRRHCRGKAAEDAHCLGKDAPVFGLRRTPGTVRFELLPDLDVREILGRPLRKRIWRTLVYTEPAEGREALFFACCGNLRKLFAKKWDQETIPMDADRTFWRFAGDWLTRYRCFTPECCPLYLKELEFRFNTPQKDWLPLLLKHLCRPVPSN
ncbi:transposase [Desulfonatronum thiodismutans]|uniref:transposase n=1 Tax=Desulfonatronum thiodismutans TaxID=159290 RepID=UPI000A0699C4|nr:transposase [Desulfonatronum thiodismutans]